MTLVVAYCDGKHISCVSDTALSWQGESFRSKPWLGTLKCIAIDKHRFIGFAGVITALDFIRTVWMNNIINYMPTEKILEFLIQKSQELNEKPDFIIGELTNDTATLFKIADGKLERNLPNVWIGSSEAFNSYQEFFHLHKERMVQLEYPPEFEAHHRARSPMLDAMNQLIDNDTDRSVGGFAIPLYSNKDQELEYNIYAGAYHLTLAEEAESDGSFKVQFGDRKTGGWACTLLVPSKPGIPSVAMFILQAQLTIIFHPMVGMNFPIRGRQPDAQKIAKEMFGFELQGITFG